MSLKAPWQLLPNLANLVLSNKMFIPIVYHYNASRVIVANNRNEQYDANDENLKEFQKKMDRNTFGVPKWHGKYAYFVR